VVGLAIMITKSLAELPCKQGSSARETIQSRFATLSADWKFAPGILGLSV